LSNTAISSSNPLVMPPSTKLPSDLDSSDAIGHKLASVHVVHQLSCPQGNTLVLCYYVS
jgi:hypothetical protein